ncbi:MAG: preprotein translocase subunit YajC [Actinomycetota bacterium]
MGDMMTWFVLAQESSGSSGLSSLLFLGGLFVLFYFLAIRPQQKRMRAQQALIASIEVGDRVETVAGIYGTVREIDGMDAKVEIAPGTIIEMSKGAIRRKVVTD